MVRKGWEKGKKQGIREQKDRNADRKKKEERERGRRKKEERVLSSLSPPHLFSTLPNFLFSSELRPDRLGPRGPLHRRLVPLQVGQTGFRLPARQLLSPRRRRELLEGPAVGEGLRQNRLLGRARDVDLDVGEREALEVEGLADRVGAVDERLRSFFCFLFFFGGGWGREGVSERKTNRARRSRRESDIWAVAGGLLGAFSARFHRAHRGRETDRDRNRAWATRKRAGRGRAAAAGKQLERSVVEIGGGAAARLKKARNQKLLAPSRLSSERPLKTPPYVTSRHLRSFETGQREQRSSRTRRRFSLVGLSPLQSTGDDGCSAGGGVDHQLLPLALSLFSLLSLHLSRTREKGRQRDGARAESAPRMGERAEARRRNTKNRTLFESTTSVITTSLPASAP